MMVSRLLKSWAIPPAKPPDCFHFLRLVKLLFEVLALRYVAGVDYDSPDARIVQQVISDRLENSPGAILVAEANLHELTGRRNFHPFPKQGFRKRRIVSMDELKDAFPIRSSG